MSHNPCKIDRVNSSKLIAIFKIQIVKNFFNDSLAIVKSTQLIYDYLWELGYDMDQEVQQGRGFTILEKINAVTEELSGAYQDVVDFAKQPPKGFTPRFL